MELVDAMCSKPDAKSVAEYSLAPCFQREYPSLYKGVGDLGLEPLWLVKRLTPFLPEQRVRSYHLLIVDVTSMPRPHAKTLEDRGMVYQPEVVRKKIPVTIGHQYSTVVLGLEPEKGMTSSWVLPLMTERVATDEDKEMVGASQIDLLMEDDELPFKTALTVAAEDSSYTKAECLYSQSKHENLVVVARCRGNRTLYHKYEASEEELADPKSGHPTWYGDRFALPDAETWSKPDETETFWGSRSAPPPALAQE